MPLPGKPSQLQIYYLVNFHDEILEHAHEFMVCSMNMVECKCLYTCRKIQRQRNDLACLLIYLQHNSWACLLFNSLRLLIHLYIDCRRLLQARTHRPYELERILYTELHISFTDMTLLYDPELYSTHDQVHFTNYMIIFIHRFCTIQ